MMQSHSKELPKNTKNAKGWVAQGWSDFSAQHWTRTTVHVTHHATFTSLRPQQCVWKTFSTQPKYLFHFTQPVKNYTFLFLREKSMIVQQALRPPNISGILVKLWLVYITFYQADVANRRCTSELLYHRNVIFGTILQLFGIFKFHSRKWKAASISITPIKIFSVFDKQ